ncbi:MAG: type II toxin-antitoxin system ParD family antitoxin [Rickettsiales bacterium]
MSSVEKISIALTPDLAFLVHKAVESGYYASSSEVIREALRDWKNKYKFEDHNTEELRALWQEGIDSGLAGEFDIRKIKKEARNFRKKNN